MSDHREPPSGAALRERHDPLYEAGRAYARTAILQAHDDGGEEAAYERARAMVVAAGGGGAKGRFYEGVSDVAMRYVIEANERDNVLIPRKWDSQAAADRHPNDPRLIFDAARPATQLHGDRTNRSYGSVLLRGFRDKIATALGRKREDVSVQALPQASRYRIH